MGFYDAAVQNGPCTDGYHLAGNKRRILNSMTGLFMKIMIEMECTASQGSHLERDVPRLQKPCAQAKISRENLTSPERNSVPRRLRDATGAHGALKMRALIPSQ